MAAEPPVPFSPRRVTFSNLSFEEKKAVIDAGRPVPNLTGLTKNTKRYVRRFNTNLYQSFPWLAGDSVDPNPCVFCFPCALFSCELNAWSRRGYTDLSNLHKAANKHEKGAAHCGAALSLAGFGKDRIDKCLDDAGKYAIAQHNVQVKKNLELFNRLIKITCFLGKQELAFRGHKEGEDSSNRGNYVELAHLLKEYDPVMAKNLERPANSKTPSFTGMSNHVQNDLIECVASEVQNEIVKELSECQFAAVLVDESSDCSNVSQVSIIIRYVTGSGAVERFSGFYDVGMHKTAQVVTDLVLKTIKKLGIHQKVVAQSYDGAAVMSSELCGVRGIMRRALPNEVVFVHCYAHCLNLVLKQSASAIPSCKVFFTDLEGIAAFFSRSPKRTKALDEIVGARVPGVCATRWTSSARLVCYIFSHVDSLVELFESIASSDVQEGWDSSTTTLAGGFLSKLGRFEFRFLLTVYDAVFLRTTTLYDILQTQALDVPFCRSQVGDVCHYLDSLRTEASFQKFYDMAIDQVGAPPPPQRKARLTIDDQPSASDRYKALYFEVLDNLRGQFSFRFGDLTAGGLDFVELLNPERYSSYVEEFPEEKLRSFISQYGKFFCFLKLKGELTNVYSSSVFSEMYPHKLYSYICEKKLQQTLSAVTTLAALILTVPTGIASVERSFSTLKRIKTFARNATSQGRLSSLATISVEKVLLTKLQASSKFYEGVVKHYREMKDDNRKIPLAYK